MAWWEKVLLAGFAVVMAGLLAILGVLIYFGFTGGSTYIERVKVDGVTCIVVRNRLTNAPESTSCPPVQTSNK